jgi:hypothetical protein
MVTIWNNSLPALIDGTTWVMQGSAFPFIGYVALLLLHVSLSSLAVLAFVPNACVVYDPISQLHTFCETIGGELLQGSSQHRYPPFQGILHTYYYRFFQR